MTGHWRVIPLEQAKQHHLYGVRGWLIVFSIGILFGLLREVGSIGGEAYKVGISITELLSVDHPATTFIKVYLTLYTLMVAAIYWLLFSKHPRFRIISTSLLLAVWPAIAIIGVIILGLGEGFALSFQSFFGWAASCAVWVTYLQRSKRVRVTFEHCILTQEESTSTSPGLSSGEKERSREAMTNPEGEDKGRLKNINHVSENDVLSKTTQEQNRMDQKPMDVNVESTVLTTAMQTIPKTELNEDGFYTQAWDEINGPDRTPNKAMWVKAFSISQGDEKKTQAKYIELRVAQLQEEQAARLLQLKDEQEQARRTEEKARAEAEKKTAEGKANAELLALARKVQSVGGLNDAENLIVQLGGSWMKGQHWLYGMIEVNLYGETSKFWNVADFVSWVRRDVIPRVLDECEKVEKDTA